MIIVFLLIYNYIILWLSWLLLSLLSTATSTIQDIFQPLGLETSNSLMDDMKKTWRNKNMETFRNSPGKIGSQRLCIRSDPSSFLLTFKDDIKKTFNGGEKRCISQLHGQGNCTIHPVWQVLMQTAIHILKCECWYVQRMCCWCYPASVVLKSRQVGTNWRIPKQIMALINVEHAEFNSWNHTLKVKRSKSFGLHQGTANPPIQVELATFGQKSGRCEVSALACLKIPGQWGAEGLVDWKHAGIFWFMSVRNWIQNDRILCTVK